jgi:hypothetical protein
MSTVGDVRNALAESIASQIEGLRGYGYNPDRMELPCVVVDPGTCTYLVGGGNCQDWEYFVYVMVPHTDDKANQAQLDSIPAAIKADDTIGLPDVDVTLMKMTGYGGESARALGIPHIGARLHVRVIVTE